MTVWRSLGLVLLSLVLLLTALIGFAPTWLRLGLTLYGVDDVTFQSLDIGWRKTELTGLTIGDPSSQIVDRISIDHTLGSMMEGRVDRITVSGLRAVLKLDDLLGDDSKETDIGIPAGTFVEELTIEQSRLELETTAGTISIPVAGNVKTNDDRLTFELSAEGASLGGAEGDLKADLTSKGALPLGDGPSLDNLTASGQLSFDADNANIPGLAEALEGAGLITFSLENGEFAASTDDWSMIANRLLVNVQPLETPWSATLGAHGPPLKLTGVKDDNNWHVAITGPLALTTKTGTLTAAIDLASTLDDRGQLRSLDRGQISVDVSELSSGDVDLQSGKALLAISGVKDALSGTLTLDAEGFSLSDGAYAIDDATLQQQLDLSFDGQTLDLTVAEKGRISIDGVSFANQAQSGWFTVRLHPADLPLLSINTVDNSWQARLAAEIDPVRLETPSGQWWARVENLAITGAGNAEGLKSGKIVLKQGRADLPGANLALVSIESELQLTEDGPTAGETIPFIIRSIRPLDDPKWFTPLRLDATVEPSPVDLSFSGHLTTRRKPGARVNFSGVHHLEAGDGGLTFDLAALTFSPEDLQPADLSPGLQAVLSDTSGRLALTGEFEWGRGGRSGTADLLIEELGLSIGPARLERVNSLIRFDSLSPLTTPAGQELAIALLNVGLPLTDGLVAMALNADGEFAVDQLTWRFAGGKVGARPFTFGSDVQDLTLLLDVDQLDLNDLLELIQLDGLSGEGRIDGELPLTISESGVVIADGELTATGKGVLRYQPDQQPGVLQAGGESMGLLLRALENFRYDDLKITLDGRTDGETNIGLHISGANPDLYEGYPIEFNLDLEGDLANLVRTNISNYQIPDRIREQLQGFGQ